MQDQRNLILAIVLSLIVVFGYEYLMPKRVPLAPSQTTATETAGAPAPVASPVAPASTQSPAVAAPSDVLAEAPRIPIATPRLKGSLSLAGARLDDLVLNGYYETVDRLKEVTLLAPAGSPAPYYVESGWTADGGVPVPGPKTVWTSAGGDKLTPDTPVTLTWDNGAGLVFTRSVSVDRGYLFTVKQTVANHGATAVALHPYSTIVRPNPPADKQAFRSEPKVVGYYGAGVEETSYKDLAKKSPIEQQATGGWIGFNDKYWLVAAVPPKEAAAALTLRDDKRGPADDHYSAGFAAPAQTLSPGATIETSTVIFAGAKEEDLLSAYEKAGIDRLERTIDFGFLWWLAGPFFTAIHFIAQHVGNFGIAILTFNVVLKIILFPLQDRSFHQMARMRDLQPKIAALKEKFGDDREKMAQAQMELFKKEKINPASGCLPVFAQLPIFYALYEVLSTTIEMRQAPFFGWIRDLSAPDPTNIFNLFGLIAWTPPAFLPVLGVWPLIYGGTMYLQQRMTPTPTTDPTQARVMALMPLVFMFFFAGFPAGLTIYYSWNAVLTMGQMALIRRRSAGRQGPAANQA